MRKFICWAIGHLLVDPYCLPDEVVKHMHDKPAPDAVCLRCERLFKVEIVWSTINPGVVIGWKARPLAK